jgi:thiol-disulfide isomerase/thioredoxin
MIKMKKLVILALVLFSFACEGTKNEVILTADASQIAENSEVYLSKIGENSKQVYIDTTVVENGSFSFDLSDQKNQLLNIIRIDGLPGNFIFVKEDFSPMQLKVDNLDLRNSELKAGKHNQLLTDYVSSLKKYSENMADVQSKLKNAFQTQNRSEVAEARSLQKSIDEESVEMRKQLIKDNPESVVSLMVLSDLMRTKKVNNQEAKEFFNSLGDDVKDLELGKSIQEQIENVGATDVGAVAPMFSGPTPEGNKLKLEDAMGKITLIDFWASWCKPCRIENPNIVDVYQDYKDKGLSIVQVSLDRQNQKKAWVNAIEADNLGDWNHVSNLMFWKDPIAVKYGIRSIPAAFLIDEDGVIIGKNLRGRQLREKVSEYLD